ncbi:MAG TPA: NAD(P)-binding domain-containing protein [Cytophagaceae bacterium]|jgi:hypothetical protein
MKIQILGTGVVGQVLASRLLQLNHNVTIGTRDRSATLSKSEAHYMTGKTFSEWHQENPEVKIANYSQLPADADVIINATSGQGSLTALEAVGSENLKSKVLLDISNPLDFSKGMPPTLSVCNTDSLAEQIQRAFPECFVVKTLNTMNAYLMANPVMVPGDHTVMVSGNEVQAKQKVTSLLKEMGWKENNIIDLGDITTARGTEMLLPLWLRLYGALGTAEFNFHIVRK